MAKQKFCQSCGMPLSKDPSNGGTSADGCKTDKYCSYCYVNGKFTFEGTVNEMQTFCYQKMVEQGHSKFLAWVFTRGMKRLERWK
jgi:hypothetical protein